MFLLFPDSVGIVKKNNKDIPLYIVSFFYLCRK